MPPPRLKFFATPLPALVVSKENLVIGFRSPHFRNASAIADSRSGHTKDFQNSIRSFRARRSALAKVRRILCMCCSS